METVSPCLLPNKPVYDILDKLVTQFIVWLISGYADAILSTVARHSLALPRPDSSTCVPLRLSFSKVMLALRDHIPEFYYMLSFGFWSLVTFQKCTLPFFCPFETSVLVGTSVKLGMGLLLAQLPSTVIPVIDLNNIYFRFMFLFPNQSHYFLLRLTPLCIQFSQDHIKSDFSPACSLFCFGNFLHIVGSVTSMSSTLTSYLVGMAIESELGTP